MGRRLTLYAKARCPLCDKALSVVEAVREALDGEVPTTLEVVDITTDADLLADYRHHIPVLAIDGRDVFRHRIDPQKLRQRLLQVEVSS